MPWFIPLLIALAVEVVAFAIIPRPAQKQKPVAVQDEQTPTADADRPIPVVFGEMTIDGTNVLWTGDKSTKTYQVTA